MTIRFVTRNAGFDLRTLGVLRQASERLDIEAWGVCGMFYRPFLNGRFGPPQISTDCDVCVATVEEARALDTELRRVAPTARWAVGWDQAGPVVPLEQPLTLRLGAVRLIDAADRVEVVVENQQVLDHLREGLLAINGPARDAASSEEAFWGEATGRAEKLLREYPGLRLSGRLADRYQQRFGYEPLPAAFVGYFPVLHTAVVRAEEQSVRTVNSVKWGGLQPAELPAAREVVHYYRTADRSAQIVPVPEQAKLPPVLEVLATAKRQAELAVPVSHSSTVAVKRAAAAPYGFTSWFHYMTYEMDDAVWREWILNQSRSRKPLGGRDEYLTSVLDGSLYAGRPGVKHDGEQKPTHGGWQLDQHLVGSALQLSTDGLLTELAAKGWSSEQLRQVRAGLRLGMLHHDIGKLVSINKPGAHGGASVALWKDTAPEWVDETAKKVASFIMMGHDYYGRLARAITEKVDRTLDDPDFDPNAHTTYRGAMCPDSIGRICAAHGTGDVRVNLSLLRLAWEADAGSVQTLRWVLPVAPMIERILLERLVK